jgi:DeoR/GlpR family transcriptional regulator of sugar metabolism
MPVANGMLNEERRQSIVEMLHRDGRVLVASLARHFRTSQITVRKDLEVLDNQGLIQRTHGGALPLQSGALVDPTLREKKSSTGRRRSALPWRPLKWLRKVNRYCSIPARPRRRLPEP